MKMFPSKFFCVEFELPLTSRVEDENRRFIPDKLKEEVEKALSLSVRNVVKMPSGFELCYIRDPPFEGQEFSVDAVNPVITTASLKKIKGIATEIEVDTPIDCFVVKKKNTDICETLKKLLEEANDKQNRQPGKLYFFGDHYPNPLIEEKPRLEKINEQLEIYRLAPKSVLKDIQTKTLEMSMDDEKYDDLKLEVKDKKRVLKKLCQAIAGFVFWLEKHGALQAEDSFGRRKGDLKKFQKLFKEKFGDADDDNDGVQEFFFNNTFGNSLAALKAQMTKGSGEESPIDRCGKQHLFIPSDLFFAVVRLADQSKLRCMKPMHAFVTLMKKTFKENQESLQSLATGFRDDIEEWGKGTRDYKILRFIKCLKRKLADADAEATSERVQKRKRPTPDGDHGDDADDEPN